MTHQQGHFPQIARDPFYAVSKTSENPEDGNLHFGSFARNNTIILNNHPCPRSRSMPKFLEYLISSPPTYGLPRWLLVTRLETILESADRSTLKLRFSDLISRLSCL